MDSIILNIFPMEIISQPNNNFKLESVTFFDRRSRENYFAMLEVALKNLSHFDQKAKIGISS